MTRQRLSKHFTIEEFDCNDGTRVPQSAVPALKELCQYVLEPMRKKYGPVKVMSGYRHEAYNHAIGGARYSMHIYDQHPRQVAADIIFARGNPSRWARGARWRFRTKARWRRGNRGGVGQYNRSGFIHVDSGPRRDWFG